MSILPRKITEGNEISLSLVVVEFEFKFSWNDSDERIKNHRRRFMFRDEKEIYANINAL